MNRAARTKCPATQAKDTVLLAALLSTLRKYGAMSTARLEESQVYSAGRTRKTSKITVTAYVTTIVGTVSKDK